MKQAKSTQLEIFWSEHISSWQQAGITQAAYCQQHELITHQFGYWKRKLLKSSLNSQQNDEVTTGFIQLPINPPSFSPETLSIRLPNDLSIEGITPANLHLVKTLTELLQ